MRLFDLSFRVKLPLLGALLIVVTALGVSVVLMIAVYATLREDARVNAEILGRALVPSLIQDLLHDDTWHAFESISAPTRSTPEAGPVKAEALLLVDPALNVFVSSNPRAAPILAPLKSLGSDYARAAEQLAGATGNDTIILEQPGSSRLYVLVPISDDRIRFGTLIIVVDNRFFLPRFYTLAGFALLAALLVLVLLLPINWYWGRRIALPLTQLSSRMGDIGQRSPATIDPKLYDYGDELGHLFAVYNQMLSQLRSKEELEKQMVQSERLAALGQLAAGMAHEINNPLGGMLTAIDTLKHHADIDPQTRKTIDLIERGLTQIKETVGALLVEARLKSRHLNAQDIDDVFTLVMPQAHQKTLTVELHNALHHEVGLPATLIRQILINLLLNAVAAAQAEGRVSCEVYSDTEALQLTLSNTGKMPTDEQIDHLFEPFFTTGENGHGLGLWVTYQIVRQLGGQIAATKEGDRMQFSVNIPLAAAA